MSTMLKEYQLGTGSESGAKRRTRKESKPPGKLIFDQNSIDLTHSSTSLD
jgi:hypothetical protein